MKAHISLCLVVSLCLGVCSMADAGSLTFSYQEPLNRTWRQEILNFRVEVPKLECKPETMYVTDDRGQVIPAQISDVQDHHEYKDLPVTVSLVADFGPWEQRAWTLHFGEPQRPEIPATDLQSTEAAGMWELSNRLIAVRTGRGSERFAQPVSADQVPAPILAVRGRSGQWLGRGWLESPQKITGYDIRLTHDGPIFKRVKAEYHFEGGRYTCYVTLRTGEDVVHVREEFDLGDPSPERDSSFCFSLYQGLQPTTVRWAGRYYDKEFSPNEPQFGYQLMQEAVFPLNYQDPKRLLRLHGLFAWWPQAAHYYAAYRHDNPRSDLIAIFPSRPGHWRNPTVIFLETAPGPDLVIRAPLRQPEQDWTVDGIDYLSPYRTGGVDPGTPRSLGIREWGLFLGTAEEVIAEDNDFTRSGIRKAWTRYGQNPLDKIKDWVLDWPDPGYEAFPRGAVTRAELPALRERVARSPALQAFVGSPQHKRFTYLVNQDAELGTSLIHDMAGGDANWMGLLPRLRWSLNIYLETQGDMGINTFMHHGNGHIAGAYPLFDVAMSIPEMTPEERREARAMYAFLLYKLSDPDWLAYNSGFHLGNPNMPTMSLSLIGAGASLIPEHPRAYDWMLRSVGSTLDMLRDFTAPGGAWRECPHYQMDASLKGVLDQAQLYRNAGFMDLYQNPFLKSTMLYHLQIIAPVDPRFGVRMMPTIGNTGYETTSLYGRMAAGVAASDPEYSRWLQWGWNAMKQPYMYPNDEVICNEDLPAEPPDMSSRNFPGFGTVMRSHFDTPQETYLIFRFGHQHEHYENEQGEIVFWAKGVPLVQDFGSLYQPMMLRPWLHNRVSFNRRLDWLSTGEVFENDFLNAADSGLGRMTVDRLFEVPEDPWEPTPPNVSPEPQFIDPVTWTRQVVLVKDEDPEGPHYVVLRDGFEGTGADFSEFSLWCLATEVQQRGNVALYKGQLGVDLSVTVLDPVQPEFSTGQYGHDFAYLGARYWREVYGPGKPFEEIQHFIRLKRNDHGGYLAVLFPHWPNEASPTFTAWGEGAGVSATIAGEQHVVICAEQPGTFAEGRISFEGQRALVRESEGRLTLGLLSGERLASGEAELRAPGPVSVTLVGPTVSGESNLSAPGPMTLTLPGETGISAALITTADGERTVEVTREGRTLRLNLPAERCTFLLR